MTAKIFAIVTLLDSFQSFAFSGPSPQFHQTSDSDIQTLVVSFEGQLGRPLSQSEKTDLAADVQIDHSPKVIQAHESDNMTSSRTLSCIGLTGSAAATISRAICASVQTFRLYELVVVGAGVTAEWQTRVWHLTVRFDGSRYKSTFDPIPGRYGLFSIGGAGGLGYSIYSGYAGNKVIEGYSDNYGIGLKLSTFAGLGIRAIGHDWDEKESD